MKETLSTSQVADRLRADENAGWTYHGAKALAEYLEQIEEDTGEEMELDVVAIRCDFAEYASAQEAASEYDWEPDDDDEDEREEKALDYLRDKTQVIEFDKGVIIQQF